MTPREVLLLPIPPNDSGALTVGGYLQALLRRLWSEGESFSGKRPFGNSGWEHDLYFPLIVAGVVEGGCLYDDKVTVKEKGNADEVVFNAISAMHPDEWAQEDADLIAAAALRAKADELDPPDDCNYA